MLLFWRMLCSFLFGACCQIQGSVDSPLVVEHELVQQSAAAASYESYGLSKKKPAAGGLSGESGSIFATRKPITASSPGYNGNQFVYTSSSGSAGSAPNSNGLDEDSSNTIDGAIGNGYETTAVLHRPQHFAIDPETGMVGPSSTLYASRPLSAAATSAPLIGLSASSSSPSGPQSDETYVTASASGSSASGAASAYGSSSAHVSTAHSEYPTRIPTGPYDDGTSTVADDGITPDHYGLLTDDILSGQSAEFTHSDITHPGVDAVIVDGYGSGAGAGSGTGSSATGSEQLAEEQQDTRTTVQTPTTVFVTEKTVFLRPAFRPKTTTTSTTTVATPIAVTNTDNRVSDAGNAAASGSAHINGATSPTGTAVLLDTTSTGAGSGIGSATALDTGSASSTGIGSGTATGSGSATAAGSATATATGSGTGPDTAHNKPQGTMSDNDIESIESIILMLNDTQTGPQYNANSTEKLTASSLGQSSPSSASTSTYSSTNSASSSTTSTTEKLTASSYYRPPSTSYVYSPQPTRRPIQVQSTIASSYGAVQHAANADVDTAGFHSVQASSESIAEHILAITKRPSLITAASFATTKQPTTQQYHHVPAEVTVSASTTIHGPSNHNKVSTRLPPSTSYVTGPTTPRPMKTPAPIASSSTTATTTTTNTVLFSPSRRPPPSITKPTNKINPPRRNQTLAAVMEPSTVYIFRPTLNGYQSSVNAADNSGGSSSGISSSTGTTSPDYYVPSTAPSSSNSYAPRPQPQHPLFYEHVVQSRPIIQYGSASDVMTGSTNAPSTTSHVLHHSSSAVPATTYLQTKPPPSTVVSTIASSAASKRPSPSPVTPPTTAATFHRTPSTSTTTEPPHPTVLITPKPTANQQATTTNTWPQYVVHHSTQQDTPPSYATPVVKVPSTSYIYNGAISTVRPSAAFLEHSSAQQHLDYPSGFGPAFHSSNSNSYHASASASAAASASGSASSALPLHYLRPQTVSSTDFEDPGYYGPTTTPPAVETVTTQFDQNNFPPVRNPGLNMTASVGSLGGGTGNVVGIGGVSGGAGGGGGGSVGGVGIAADDYADISTPDFVEDEALNDKMGLLVSKIVESLQGNFEQLADVVYDDVVVRDPVVSTKRPPAQAANNNAASASAASGTTTKRPATTVTRITTRRPGTTAIKPATSGSSSSSSSRPTARPAVAVAADATATAQQQVTTKRPTASKATTVPTKKPTTTSAKRTTKRPPTTVAAAAVTTRRPTVTKVI